MKHTILAFLIIVFNLSCAQTNSKSILDISPKELEKVVLVDVRTAGEFNAGHLDNALNIDWFDVGFQSKIESTIPKDKTVYVYCKVGGRSAKAAEKLEALGYTVVNLEGGYDVYKKGR